MERISKKPTYIFTQCVLLYCINNTVKANGEKKKWVRTKVKLYFYFRVCFREKNDFSTQCFFFLLPSILYYVSLCVFYLSVDQFTWWYACVKMARDGYFFPFSLVFYSPFVSLFVSSTAPLFESFFSIYIYVSILFVYS